MHYGVSYYPEHKNSHDLAHDMKLLKESGINTIRMGEFAWNFFEPTEGVFEFDWLDSIVTQLGEAGIQSILCTPTACPPAWMTTKYPAMLYVDNRGVTRPFGGRRHYCYNSEDYRRHCALVTEAMAMHYENNPHVIAWQIDNELAQEGTGRCHCPTCVAKFQRWLVKKYGNIDEFNRRIGSPFWAQRYDSFGQVTPPLNSIEVGAQPSILAFHENPTIRLEFERFCSDSMTDFQEIQRKILHGHTKAPVSTNATGLATNSINYYDSFQKLDAYGFDYYPGLRDAAVDSFPYAFGRGVKEDTPAFWVLEFMSGGGHRFGGSGRLQPNPGALEQSVIHSLAHGAEMMMHFQFRTFPFGAEQLNYAIVHMDGTPRRHYYEMQHTAAVLRQLAPLEQAEFRNEVAICFDYDCHWALKIKPINDPVFDYINYATAYYDELSKLGVNSDVISFNHDFSKYKVIIVPAGFILSENHQSKLIAFAKAGGTVVGTFITSVKNPDNVGYTTPLPAGLNGLFGVEVQEVEPIYPDRNHAQLALTVNGVETREQDWQWSELLDGSAEFIGTYTDGYKAGHGVVSKNKFGNGFGYYVGTGLQEHLFPAFLEEVIKTAGLSVNPVQANPASKVEIIRRFLNEKEYSFLFNFDRAAQSIPLSGSYEDYLTKEQYRDAITLQQNEYIIISRV